MCQSVVVCVFVGVSAPENIDYVCKFSTLTLFAEWSLPATRTMAVTVQASAVTRTAGHFALMNGYVTFGTLPALLAVAQSTTVVAV
jgi:hypothetical protein